MKVSSEDEEDTAQMCIFRSSHENINTEEVAKATESPEAVTTKTKEESFTSEAEAWLQQNVMIEYWNGVTNSYMKTGGRCSSISIDW